MRSIKWYLLFVLLAFLAGCGGGGGGGGGGSQKTLISIVVTPALPMIAAGQTEQFTATGHYSDSSTQILTNQVTWTSSSTNVAQINSSGLVSAASSVTGTPTTLISAALAGITGSTTLTVTPSALTSVTVAASAGSITSGATLQFTATGHFSDGSTLVLTNVTWASSGTTIEPISATGLLTGAVAGTTTITATSNGIPGTATLTVTNAAATGPNVLTITVNGSLCSPATSASYPNKPCVSVTICDPSDANQADCQIIPDILLDTGSFGLRIFNSAFNPPLPLAQIQSGSSSLVECVPFADLSSLWGPVKFANVILAGEPAVQIPIQVVDATFAAIPSGSPCATTRTQLGAATSPAEGGLTRLRGGGNTAEDGNTSAVYYLCNGTSCSETSPALTNQVVNPVARLPRDNNGVMVSFPAVNTAGVASLNGSLTLGIDTESNNASTGFTGFPTDAVGDFTTTFQGSTFTNNSFFDTGSNGTFFPGSLTPCSTNPNNPLSGWYCPASLTPLVATTPEGAVNFQIGNFSQLTGTAGLNVFVDLGGPSSFGFDWGLPIFFGRNVFIGINGKPSAGGLGTGPYLAFKP